jgi:hypothetical protein
MLDFGNYFNSCIIIIFAEIKDNIFLSFIFYWICFEDVLVPGSSIRNLSLSNDIFLGKSLRKISLDNGHFDVSRVTP